MAAIRRNPISGSQDDGSEADQQALLSLMDQPGRTTMPVPALQASQPAPPAQAPVYGDQTGSDNTGITGSMDKGVSGPTATTTGSVSGAASGANPAWDTDSYSAPQYTADKFGGAMSGWDAGKWGDANNQHPKYVVGRILSNHPATVQGLQEAVPDIQKAYPGTTFNGKDKLTIPGVGTVDVLQGAGKGGEAWRWGADEGAAAGAAAGAAPLLDASGQPASSSLSSLTQPSTYQKLMQYLQQLNGPAATDQDALLSQMTPPA